MTTEKIKVTNNEFQEITKNASSLYWEKVFAIDKNLSKEEQKYLINQYEKEFSDSLNQYEIIPFEIHCNNEQIQRLINQLCTTSETIDEFCTLYRGHIMGDGLYLYLEKITGFKSFQGGNCYSNGHYNDELLIITSYCEGDVCFKVYITKESYQEGFEKAKKFYEEEF